MGDCGPPFLQLGFSLFGVVGMEFTVLIDADPIVYRSGFANEVVLREILYTIDDEPATTKVFEPSEGSTALRNCMDWLLEMERMGRDVEVLESEAIRIPDPDPSHAFYTAKRTIQSCRKAAADNLNIDLRDVRALVYLTGKGNFRERIATVKPYKGNRDASHKPALYEEIRQYLIDHHDAIVVDGIEADDAVAIACWDNPSDTCICTIDKDLDQVPGYHYNYGGSEHAWYMVDPDEADRFFYKQILMGDVTDNICGCYQIGKRAANAIVDEFVLAHGWDHAELWRTIVRIYEKSLEKYGEKCPYYDKAIAEGVEAVVIEMAQLVKMQEYEGQLWMPPEVTDELLVQEAFQ